MRLLWKSQLANADEGGEGVVCCVDPIVDMNQAGVNQMWRACGRIDCKADWCCHKRMIMAIGAGYKKKHLMVRDELAMKDGEEYERMTGGLADWKAQINTATWLTLKCIGELPLWKNMREWQGDGEALIGFEHWMNTKRWRAGYRTNRLCPRLLNHSPVFVITIKLSVSSPCTPQYLQISNQMFFWV